MKFSEHISAKEFLEYSEHTKKGNYLQTIQMAELKRSRGRDIFFCGLWNDARELVYAAVVCRMKITFGYSYTIDGFEQPDSEEELEIFLEGLKQFVEKNKGIFLKIIPNSYHRIFTSMGFQIDETNDKEISLFQKYDFAHHQPKNDFMSNGNPSWIFIKEMEGRSEQEIVKTYKKKAVYSLKKTKQFGITIRELSYGELSKFKKVTEETSERRDFQDKPLSYYQMVYKIYKDRAKFMVAEIDISEYLEGLLAEEKKLMDKIAELDSYLSQHENKQKKGYKKKEGLKKELTSQAETYQKRMNAALIIKKENETTIILLACALFIISPQETVYLFSGTVEHYKNMYAPFLIQDAMIRYTAKHNIPLYNFYGIKGVFDGSDGLLRFKDSFDGMAVELVGEFTYTTNNLNSKCYTISKKILSSAGITR